MRNNYRAGRATPKPYQRRSVTITHTGPKRSWRHTNPANLTRGDTIPDIGEITEIITTDGAIVITGQGGNTTIYQLPATTPVLAFTHAPEWSEPQ